MMRSLLLFRWFVVALISRFHYVDFMSSCEIVILLANTTKKLPKRVLPSHHTTKYDQKIILLISSHYD